LPPLVQLETAVAHLVHVQDDRTLICLVEAWSSQGDPPQDVLIALSKALLRLGLYDRAWGRLQTLQGQANPEIAILTGQMFMARGWNNKARKTLETALKTHPENRMLSDLYDQASEPATEPNHADGEPADAAAAIAAARHFMATGALLRARAILDRFQRAQKHDDVLVSDLLWAIEGDFSLQEGSLHDLASSYGTGLQSLPDLPEDPDHTETADVDDVIPPPDEGAAFPSLFRNMEPQTEFYGETMDGDDEITHVSAMASALEMKEETAATRETDPGELMPAQEVTQIQMVVRKDGNLESDTASLDREAVFDLATLPPVPTSDFDMGPEQEDADVVVHTRTEDEPDDAEIVTQIGAIPLALETAPQNMRALEDEAATWVKPPERPPERPSANPPARQETKDSPRPSTPRPVPKKARPAAKKWRQHLAAMLVVIVVATTLSVVALAAYALISWL
jgi:hypothetical protein